MRIIKRLRKAELVTGGGTPFSAMCLGFVPTPGGRTLQCPGLIPTLGIEPGGIWVRFPH